MTTTNTKKTNTIGCDNLIDNAFVANTPKETWESEEICRAKVMDNRTLRQKNADRHKKMAEGYNKVMLMAASYRCKGNREMFVLELRNVGGEEAHAWAEEKFIALFPGDDFTDKKGMFHEAGWNWEIFSNEIAKQHKTLKGKGVEEQLVKLAGKTFGVYLHKNVRTGYTEMFMTLDAYNSKIDKLAKKSAVVAEAGGKARMAEETKMGRENKNPREE